MNEPIISPFIFYLIYISDSISSFLFIMTILSIITLVTYTVFSHTIYSNKVWNREETGDYLKQIKHNIKNIIIVILTISFINTIVPTKDTLYKMLIASEVTPQNIEIVGDTVENSIDYIFEKINGVVEDNKE